MTREEAINLIDINRSNLKATNEEGFSKDIEALDEAIKALEQEPVVDKIRADIIAKFSHNIYAVEHGYLEQMLEIIDKYKAESEDKE